MAKCPLASEARFLLRSRVFTLCKVLFAGNFRIGETDSVHSNETFPYSAEMVKVLKGHDREPLSEEMHVDDRYRVNTDETVAFSSRSCNSSPSSSSKNDPEDEKKIGQLYPRSSRDSEKASIADASTSHV